MDKDLARFDESRLIRYFSSIFGCLNLVILCLNIVIGTPPD